VAASLIYVALEDGMGIVWEAPRRYGLEAGLRLKLLAIGLVLLGAAVLAAELIASVILGGISDALSNRELINDAANIVASLLSAVILAVRVLTIFKYIPRVPVGWSSAIISSVITTAALLIGTRLTVVYLNHFTDASVVGVTSALLGLLAWLYLEAQVLLAGAELNRAIEQPDTPAPQILKANVLTERDRLIREPPIDVAPRRPLWAVAPTWLRGPVRNVARCGLRRRVRLLRACGRSP
jgi:uncharacterized BrkB/YihY/UPF0761 family membrane protein